MNIYPLLIDGAEIAMERQIYKARETAQRLANSLGKLVTLQGGREYGWETYCPAKPYSPFEDSQEYHESFARGNTPAYKYL